MNDLKLGQIIEEERQRDAIHVAIAPVVAGEKLSPGDHVGFLPDGRFGESKDPVGVVDPFLKKTVKPGQSFWLFLYPGTITALRHEWTHPAFGKFHPAMPESEKWIREYADSDACAHLGYAELMSAAEMFVKYGEYLCHGGRFEGMRVSDEFWKHYQIVTGEAVPEAKQGSIFTCSC